MIAGAICEESDCTGLVLILLAAMAAFALILIVVMFAWMATVSTILERHGWAPVKRRTIAVMPVSVGAVLLWALATALPEVGGVVAPVLALVAVPVALWQRRVTRRAQSSPCSTA